MNSQTKQETLVNTPVDQNFIPTPEMLFLSNFPGMIMLNGNYVYETASLLFEIASKRRVEGVPTFCFYQRYFTYGNYQTMPKLPKQFDLERNYRVKRLMGYMRVSMPSYVFDEFIELVEVILINLWNKVDQDEIAKMIFTSMERYPHLALDQNLLQKLGYQYLPSEKSKRFHILQQWILSLITIVHSELNMKNPTTLLKLQESKYIQIPGFIDFTEIRDETRQVFPIKVEEVDLNQETQLNDEALETKAQK